MRKLLDCIPLQVHEHYLIFDSRGVTGNFSGGKVTFPDIFTMDFSLFPVEILILVHPEKVSVVS